MGLLQNIKGALSRSAGGPLPGGLTVAQWLQESQACRGPGYDAACARALDYYLGTTRAQVVSALREKFPATWPKMVPVALSLFRRIILERACVYAGEDGGERFDLLGDDGTPIEGAGGTTWREVLDDSLLVAKLTEANRWAEACRLAYLRFAWDADAARVRVDLFPAHKVFARFAADSYAPDSAEWLLEVEPLHRDGKAVRRFEFWSADASFIVLETGERIDGPSAGRNPYSERTGEGDAEQVARAVVPIVPVLGPGHDAGYHLPPDEQLIDAQRAADALTTALLHLASVAGYGQPVSETQGGASDAQSWTGTDDGKGAGSVVTFGPDELIQVPRGRTLEFKALQAQFAELQNVLDRHVRNVCAMAGVPAANVLPPEQGRQVSGYALQVEREPLKKHRREAIRYYRDTTHRALALLRDVWNAHQPSDATRFRGWPSWTPGEIAPPVDPEQRRRVDEVEIRIGVSSPVRVLMRDQGISRKEAMVRAAEIAAENAPRLAAQGLGRLAAFGPAAEAARARVEMAAEDMMPGEMPADE